MCSCNDKQQGQNVLLCQSAQSELDIPGKESSSQASAGESEESECMSSLWRYKRHDQEVWPAQDQSREVQD